MVDRKGKVRMQTAAKTKAANKHQNHIALRRIPIKSTKTKSHIFEITFKRLKLAKRSTNLAELKQRKLQTFKFDGVTRQINAKNQIS